MAAINSTPAAMAIHPVLNLAISGHTNLNGRLSQSFDPEKLQHLFAAILEYFDTAIRKIPAAASKLYNDTRGEIRILSCVAPGTDELMIETAHQLRQEWAHEPKCRISIFGIFPEGDRTVTPPNLKSIQLDKLYIDADSTQCYQPKNNNKELRDFSYQDANQIMLEHADFVILVWDEKKDSHLGGTYAVLRQAREAGIPIILLVPGKKADADIDINFVYRNKTVAVTYHQTDSGYTLEHQNFTQLEQIIDNILIRDPEISLFHELCKADLRCYIEENRREPFSWLSIIPKVWRAISLPLRPILTPAITGYDMISKYLYNKVNNGAEDEITPDAEEKALSETYHYEEENIKPPFKNIYEHFDRLAQIYERQFRITIKERIWLSLLAIICMATGIAIYGNLGKSAGLKAGEVKWEFVYNQSQFLYYALIIIVVLLIVHSTWVCFRHFITDQKKYWWWYYPAAIGVCYTVPWFFTARHTIAWCNLWEPGYATGGYPQMWYFFAQILYMGAIISVTLHSKLSKELPRFYFYRTIAEHARLSNYTWHLGSYSCVPIETEEKEQPHQWPAWYFRAVYRTIGPPSGHITQDSIEAHLQYINKQLAEGQKCYHRNRYRKNICRGRKIFTAAAIFFIIWMGGTMFRIWQHDWHQSLDVIIPFSNVVSVGIISLAISIISCQELFKFANISHYMYHRHAKLQKSVDAILKNDNAVNRLLDPMNFNSAWRIVKEINRFYIDEVNSWQKTVSDKKLKAMKQ